MRKYVFETRSGSFAVFEYDGASHLTCEETYYGSYPTSALAANALATGNGWAAKQERPSHARAVSADLSQWLGMWVQFRYLPDFLPNATAHSELAIEKPVVSTWQDPDRSARNLLDDSKQRKEK